MKPTARRVLPFSRSNPWWQAALAAAAAFAIAGCASSPRIHDRPIPFGEDRRDATLDYMETHYGTRPSDISIVPRIVVLHWTAIPTFQASLAAFAPEELPGTRADLGGAGQVNVSIQFLVDRDGSIHRLMPETWMARHVIGLNASAIGVENVGGDDGADDLTDEQIEANARLVRYLARNYPTIDYLIGHMEYREFEGHPLWRELDPTYRTDKIDPGERFMNAVRAAVADLGLKGVAEIRAEIEAAQD
jgi:N-acetylmuramoyl-L-alanine amidase